MRILLIIPSAEGDRHSYTESLVRAFSSLGHEVLHFSQSAGKPKKTDKLQTVFFTRFKYCLKIYIKLHRYLIKNWQIRGESLLKWQRLFDHIQDLQKDSNGPDLLFFESLDASMGQYITKRFIDKKLTIPFSGILVCPEDIRLMAKSFLRKGPFDPYNVLKSKWCTGVGVVMEESIYFLPEIIHKPVELIPDIVSVMVTIQNTSLGDLIIKRAGNRFIIGFWGSLSERKGISDFLQMSLKLPSGEYFIVMGGLISTEGLTDNDKNKLQEGTSGKIGNLLIINKWLSNDELLSGMKSCDLIYAVYPFWRFSSGIIGHAAIAGVPILVNDGFVMAGRVKDYNIGFVKLPDTDVCSWVADNKENIRKLSESRTFKEGCSKYCENYSFEQWQKSISVLLNHRNIYPDLL
jgi:glycosyltransferase involved in cell wall biosynthesis